jgi:hypothetical protein
MEVVKSINRNEAKTHGIILFVGQYMNSFKCAAKENQNRKIDKNTSCFDEDHLFCKEK